MEAITLLLLGLFLILIINYRWLKIPILRKLLTGKTNQRKSNGFNPGGLFINKKNDFEIGGDLGLSTRDQFYDQVQKTKEDLSLKPQEENNSVKGASPTQGTGTPGEVWAPTTSKLAGSDIPESFAPQPQPVRPYNNLPERYGDNLIIALVRDPYWIFAYWETNEQKIQEIVSKYALPFWEEVQHILRVYDTTDLFFNGYNAHYHFDIPISHFLSASWHIEVGQPNRTYCIERGLILPNGQYVPLARSNFVTTPANAVSHLIDEQWMLLSESEQKLYQYLEQMSHETGSPQFAMGISLAEEITRIGLGVSSPEFTGK